MKNLAIVPVKGLTEAKKRLANYLGPSERRRLVLAMLADVLSALHRSKMFVEILVISPDESIAREAGRNNSSFARQSGAGLNSAVHQAVRLAFEREIFAVTTVLADLPLLEPRDIEELVQISRETPRVVLVPSSKGGTNILLRAPPDAIATAYGRWSYGRHLRSAQEKGVTAYSVSNPRVSFDVDTVEDLRTLRQMDSSEKTNAGRLAGE
ncbi:MAG TPA: 2-phospho-L-lactate guanylyltransferase, partial [Candidatus Bathyarchaeia archaeon]